MSKFEKESKEKKVKALVAAIDKLELELEAVRSNKIYETAFEWRFEFPEVLNDDGDFVGFDVVIGNPPYIRQEEFTGIKKILQTNYDTYSGAADLYVYFVEKGLNILCDMGKFVYILPNKWMRSGYGENLRKWVRQFDIVSIIDFCDLPVFEEATTYPCIWSITNSKPNSSKFISAIITTLNFPNSLEEYISANKFEVDSNLLGVKGWSLANDKIQFLLEKIKQNGQPLSDYADNKIYRGIVTGLNEAFVIDRVTKNRLLAEDNKSEKIIKPFLAGRDIKRYQHPQSDKYLILSTRGIEIETYPAIFAHLNKYKEQLKKKAGSGAWYELQASPGDLEKFEEPKIMYPDISKELNFIIDVEKHYSVNTVYNIGVNSLGLLGYLNSRLFYFYFQNISNSLRGGYFRFFTDYMKECPIPNSFSGIELFVTQILAAKKDNPDADTAALEKEIDRLVYELYGLTDEEIQIVEGE